MGIRRGRRVFGFMVFILGIGILLTILVPTIGWIFFTAVALICCGIYLLRGC